MPDARPPSIDTLLEQCILALEGGDQAAVDGVLRAHPQHEPALRARLGHLSALGILHAPKTTAIPEQLGEFRLLRQIGRGGMGVVYLAEQPALQRQVALKLVHPEQLFFAGARERFRREVLAIARLQHPGIVPILTCGEAEGIPFYAMELVHGASLAEILQELAGTAPTALDGMALRQALQRAMAKKHELAPIHDAEVFHGAWPQVAAKLVHDAARALQHAHAQGVLHRDLKPSNLLLTNAGDVRLIDFGLAAAEGEQRLTRSGATFGALPYMAPEQVRGDTARIDRRTDVYQLGVTLYELLTLTLPHGDGSGTTRERIVGGVVTPPQKQNPQVHPDLEAVCLLAMDPDQGRRYADAGNFADDLQAFREQRSVRARAPSRWLKLRRWMRRHPARAAAAAVALFVLGPAPLALALQQSAANERITAALQTADEQRRAAERNLTEAERQHALAETNLEEALAAVDLMLRRTAEARLSRTPGTARLRRQLLTDALEFHQRLGRSADTDGDRLQFARARAETRLATLHIDLGELGAAKPLLQSARATLHRLGAAHDATSERRQELAWCSEQMANVAGRTGDGPTYLRSQQDAVAGYRRLAAATGDPRHVEGLLRCELGLARAHARLRDVAAAMQQLDALDRRFADDAEALRALRVERRTTTWAEVAEARGVLQASAGDAAAAADSFAEAARRLATLPPAAATDDEVAQTWATVHERLGTIHHQLRQYARASEPLDRACSAFERLAATEPEYPTWRQRLARTLSTRASNRRALGDTAGQRTDHDRAVQLLELLVATTPDEPGLRRSLALALAERADAIAAAGALADGDVEAAAADQRRAIAEFEAVLAAQPDDAQARANLAAICANRSSLLLRRGELDEAAQLSARALALVDQERTPDAVALRCELLVGMADLELRRQAPEPARALFQRADAESRALLAARDTPAAAATRLMVVLNHGLMRHTDEGAAVAYAHWCEVVPVGAAAATASEQARTTFALLCLRLCAAALELERVEAAREHFRQALAAGATPAMTVGSPMLAGLFEHTTLRDLLPETSDGR
ncbi:MAG: protein kinase domain-containing protein [Planctomycetota bacterium]